MRGSAGKMGDKSGAARIMVRMTTQGGMVVEAM
jgi:hypothetical protein